MQEQTESLASIYNSDSSAELPRTVSNFYALKVASTCGWIDFVICALVPFSVVDNDTYRIHLKQSPIDLQNLMSYISLLTRDVEEKI